MAKKPALCYAIARGAHFSGDFVVIRVSSERERQFSGVEVGNITSTTRSIRDLIAKFPNEETATKALTAYIERWRAHRPLIEAAERRLRIERTNRATSAMDALKAYQSPPHVPTAPLIAPLSGPPQPIENAATGWPEEDAIKAGALGDPYPAEDGDAAVKADLTEPEARELLGCECEGDGCAACDPATNDPYLIGILRRNKNGE